MVRSEEGKGENVDGTRLVEEKDEQKLLTDR